IMPEETVTYILTVTAGPELDLVDMVVTAEDLEPQGLHLFEVSYDETVFERTAELEWTALDTILAGQIEEIRVTYKASSDVDSMPATVTMVARVTATDVYGRDIEDEDEETLPVLLPESHLLLEKVALASALVPGEELTYLITATNNGNQNLANLTITDFLPEQLTTYASYYDSSRITFDGDPSTPTWTLNEELEPGEAISVRLVVESEPDPTAYGETTTDVAEASAEDEGGEILTARATDILPVHTPDVAVGVTKIPNENLVVPGEQVSYTIIVENVGRTDLEEITLTEDIPPGLTYASSYFDEDEVSLVEAADEVVWDIEPLAPGRSVSLQVFFNADPDPGVIANPVANTAIVEATGPGGVEASDMATASLPVQESEPSILVEKRALVSVARPGERVEYVITVTNDGNLPLHSVTISDSLEAGLEYVGSRFNEDLIEETGASPLLAWSLIGEFEPGESRQIYLTVLLSADPDSLEDPVSNTAVAEGLTPGEDLVSDQSTELLPLQMAAPRVTIQKFTTAPVVWPGEDILYTIQVTNTGNRDIVKAVIRDNVPLGLSYVSSVYDPTVISPAEDVNTPAWRVAALPVGATETITIRLHADESPRAIEDPVVNLAEINAWDEYGEYFSDSDFEETPLADLEPALNVDVIATQGSVVPGKEITYLIEITNTGDEELSTVTVTDTIPHGLSIFSTDYDPLHVVERREKVPVVAGRFAGTGGAFEVADSVEVITWSIEILPKAAIEHMRLTCRVAEDASELDDPVVNTVYASGTALMGDPISDYDTERLAVVLPGSAIGVDKTAMEAAVVPGEYVSYVLTVRNAGSTDLQSVALIDYVPTGFEFKYSSYDNTSVLLSEATEDSILWTIGELPVGGYEEVRVTYRAQTDIVGNAHQDTLRTTARAYGTDPSHTIVSDEASFALPIEPKTSSVQIVKWTDATGNLISKGTEIAYHIQVVNTGDQDLQAVLITDHMLPGLRYLTSDIAPDSVDASGDTTYVYWSLDLLHHVEAWEVLVRARVDTMVVDGQTIRNMASVVATDERGGNVYDTDESVIVAGLPDVIISKTVDKPRAKPGEKVTYTVTYRNSGTADAKNVVVIDELPEHVSYVPGSATGGAYYEPRFNTITRRIPRLEIDHGAIFSYQVTIDPETE
ncbi:MAG: hypothetical protein DRH04_07580, partial [Deltaproteobacteria bacterium]